VFSFKLLILKNLFTTIPFIFLLINCWSQPGETCATATLINSIPFIGTGSTVNANDDYFANCQDYGNQGGANDLVYEYTNGPNQVYVDISFCEDITDYDSQL
jgi:hypothetical protein